MENPLSSFVTLILVCFSLYYLLISYKKRKHTNLPPGPPSIPIFTNIIWLCKSFSEIQAILRTFKSKYGPIVTVPIGHRKVIFISSHDLAHKALIQSGSIFADRPPVPESTKLFSSNQHNISSAGYGPLWRLLRRNLTAQILHPSRVKSYSPARKWVLEILKQGVSNSRLEAVKVMDHFQYAMFCLLVLMCFGERVDEKTIREIEKVQRDSLLNLRRFNILNFLPRLGKILFRKRWIQLYELRRNQESVLVPLVRYRRDKLEEMIGDDVIVGYVDSLLSLTLPEEGDRKLTEGEIVTLCSEFLNAGTDTTSTALQWIMANLVKHPEIQSKLFEEIKVVGSDTDDEIKEEDLHKLTYLKAVVLEGLRRHPPGHFVLPHAVAEDTQLDGYDVPKNAVVNFMVAEIGWDPKVWEDPMEFKPERFLGEGENFDVTGSREVKMMPFGVGRRICPGLTLAMLHLEYFVANLVKDFEWTAVTGDDIDLSEKQEFTMVMKNPLHAHITPRIK
ncbi:hypothetical protein GIB67_012182 [Kingdonia uniflora]|uniref:Cytochrome P450 n=1 Tax=Kingdonia uniflora TaxID=39325 RepID=A0A7J7NP86_9MAGN|nr:hypothetical protein GIB67_012182 [Kingdonia uniflora]